MTNLSLSLCMIVRDESANLDNCLSSVAKYVDEIIVVDTGSKDNTKEIALKHGAQVFDFNEHTNPEAFLMDDESTEVPPPYSHQMILADFSAARQYSFSKATKDYVLWIDADDTVVGADKLPEVMAELAIMGKESSAWFRYDYSFVNGKPNCQLWRERILRRGSGKWLNPIHEIHEMIPGTVFRHFDQVVIQHNRDLSRPRTIANRNLKVLKKQYKAALAANNLDARTLFYLGNEAKFVEPKEAIGYYEKYLTLSGWDEERAIARIYLGQIHESFGDLEAAFKAYSSAALDFPPNPDPWFASARIAYMRASAGEFAQWQKCCERTEHGFSLGNPQSAIMFNPIERTFQPHVYYNVALSKLGRIYEASESCAAALAIFPDTQNLIYNKGIYDAWIANNPKPAGTVTRQNISVGSNPLEGEAQLPTEISTALALQVWREMLRFDEISKAKKYLDALPYFMNTVEVQRAKEKTDELLKAASFDSLKEKYGKISATEAISIDTELDKTKHPLQFMYWTSVIANLPKGKTLRILDISCKDGWLGNRLAKLGHSVLGMDMFRSNLDIANNNASKLNVDAVFIEGSFKDLDSKSAKVDVVICIEHAELVDDDVELYSKLATVLKPGGRLILATPRGAWLQGAYLSTYNKWDEPRDRIRSYSAETLTKVLSDRFSVKSMVTKGLTVNPDVPNQACLIAVADKKSTSRSVKPTPSGMNIIIHTGPAVEWWSPDSIHTTGIGGSETAVIRMGEELARLGHKVTVFSDCPHMDGLYNNVEYIHYGAYRSEMSCDVFISSRNAAVVPPKSKLKLLWVHDVHVGGASADMHSMLLKYDYYLCLSNWHKQFFLDSYKFLHPDNVIVTRNGIDLERFATKIPKQNDLIYASSPTRGIDVLLDLMPRIVERVPGAHLHVYYGFESWEASSRGDVGQQSLIQNYKKKLNEANSVTWHGRTNQWDLAKAFLKSKVWAYPTWFTETSCITAMEAQAAGCVPVTTRLGALTETVQSGILIPGDSNSEEYKQTFVDNVVSLLLNDNIRSKLAKDGIDHASTLSWRFLAHAWEGMFLDLIKKLEVNLVHKFNG